MFRYYSVTEKSPWEITIDSPEAIKELTEKDCAMVGVLGISDQVNEDTDPEKLTYKGGLYFDIDNDGDIPTSISSVRNLIGKLKCQGVDRQDIHVWASGKKGFHLIVNEKVFSSGRAVKFLPHIYKEMALELFVDGLDMSVYSAKKGRLWRQENVRRPDNGKFKVQLMPDEVDKLTPEYYSEITSEPRNIQQIGLVISANRLSVLFELCKKKAASKNKQRQRDIESQVSDSLLKEFCNNVPGCIQTLIDEGDTTSGSNFNQAAMQMGVFVARSGMRRSFWDPLIKSMAKNVKSGSYKTERDRYEHLVGMIRYASVTPTMIFSRGALFSVIEPCGGCPICQSEEGKDLTEGGELDDLGGIIEKENGYYLVTKEGQKRVSTFIIKPENFYTAKAQDTEMTRRVGIEASVEVKGKHIATVKLDEGAWKGRGPLIDQLQGITNLGFFGGDQEVQRIKHYLFTKEFDMGEIQQVYSAGIHRHTIGSRSTLVYVEPGFSVTAQRERDTHYVDGRIPAPPRIAKQEFPDKEDVKEFKVFKETIKNLMRVNKPYIVGQILGWYAACHLKVHLQSIENQFPILNLWGNAESGKTTTAALFACLHGCDYIMEDSPVSLGGATPWAVANFAASTTTTARLLDEFNKSKIKDSNYNYFAEVMKAAWNNQTFSRGAVTSQAKADGKGRSGAGVIDYKISGPLVVMSEQSPEMPALKQRMVQVGLSSKGRAGCDDAFYETLENREQLWKLSRAMVWASLSTLPGWTRDKMKSYRPSIPRMIEARSNYSYRVVLTGLDFFHDVLEGLGLEIGEEVEDLKSSVLAHLEGHEKNISKDKSKTEVDAVMEDMNVMAGMEDGNKGSNYLEPGIHYVLAEGKLHIDTLMAHALYKKYTKSYGSGQVVIANLNQFRTLLSQEPYYLHTKKMKLTNSSRDMAVLDVDRMNNKGLETGHFRSALESV